MLSDVEYDAIHVFELLLGINTGIARQLHEELAAQLFDLVGGRALVINNKADVMQAGPIRSILAADRTLGKMQQREIDDAIRERDRVADRAFHFGNALELEYAFVKSRRLFELGNLHGDMPDFGHGYLLENTSQLYADHARVQALNRISFGFDRMCFGFEQCARIRANGRARDRVAATSICQFAGATGFAGQAAGTGSPPSPPIAHRVARHWVASPSGS